VAVRYALDADGGLSFGFGAYNHSLPLTIDPTLEYSTFLGGSDDESGEIESQRNDPQ